MRTLIEEYPTAHTPLTLAASLRAEPNLVCLHSALRHSRTDRFSFVAVRPFARLVAHGTQCRLSLGDRDSLHFGNPWNYLDSLLAQYELLEEPDLPFPLGGALGYWGYELNRSLSAKLASKAARTPEMPDLCLGFYPSLCAFDHQLQKCWIIATGMEADGSRSATRAQAQRRWWQTQLDQPLPPERPPGAQPADSLTVQSNLSRNAFIKRVEQAQAYIQSGNIYQLNLSHRLECAAGGDPLSLFFALNQISPAPYAAYLGFPEIQIASASPESFLQLSGRHIRTRPIKGTRPRSSDPQQDAQWTFELQSSTKEQAELVMITDLLRNDLGQICDYGSVTVPELVRLERFPQVQHLVSTVEGLLRPNLRHTQALAKCFPGGSITGAPKLRAMQLIDELEPVARGPYTGAIGYLGFNQESHLNIAIRTAYQVEDRTYFNVGAGIVADSDAAAEYDETLAKARGFLDTLNYWRTPTGNPAPGQNAPRRKGHRHP